MTVETQFRHFSAIFAPQGGDTAEFTYILETNGAMLRAGRKYAPRSTGFLPVGLSEVRAFARAGFSNDLRRQTCPRA